MITPGSHTSPGSTAPLPHRPVWHAPPTQLPSPPLAALHGVPSARPAQVTTSAGSAQPPAVHTLPSGHVRSLQVTSSDSTQPANVHAMTINKHFMGISGQNCQPTWADMPPCPAGDTSTFGK